ncbi:MAG: hypothetical protein H0X37_08790 [Herpetosiphonaceae bacterium]|nr:hypothetical protein [Herpetosiphonaceae bacterium]
MLQGVELRRRVAFARWCSDVGSPPVFTVLTIALIAGAASHTLSGAIAWASALSLIVAGLPLAYVLWLVRCGVVTDIHLPLRRERVGPIIASLLAALGAMLLGYKLAAPLLIQRLLSVYAAQALILGVITLWWKISFHAAAVGFFVGVALALGGTTLAPLLGLVPLVGWARLTLHRHTPRQVIAGAILGLLTAALL